MEVRNLRLCDLDFDRKQLKVVQGKGKKTAFATFRAFIRGLKKYIEAEKPKIISLDAYEKEELALRLRQHDSRYSQQGVQWVVKAGIKTAKY